MTSDNTMILGGHIAIDKDGKPVRGFNGRISFFTVRLDAEGFAKVCNTYSEPYASRPVRAVAAELRIIDPDAANRLAAAGTAASRKKGGG